MGKSNIEPVTFLEGNQQIGAFRQGKNVDPNLHQQLSQLKQQPEQDLVQTKQQFNSGLTLSSFLLVPPKLA